MLHNTRLERLSGEKYSSLLGPFVSYEENEVQSLVPKKHFSRALNSGIRAKPTSVEHPEVP